MTDVRSRRSVPLPSPAAANRRDGIEGGILHASAVAVDVFISYNRRDTGPAETLASALRDRGLSVFLDRWSLTPGSAWTPGLERALAESRTVVVVLGPGGMTEWQRRESEYAFDRAQSGEDVRVVPVLIPGGDPPLGFLRLTTWVDLRAGLDQPPLLDLLAGTIRGDVAGTRPSICPYRGLQPFRQEDAPFFFGRDEFIKRAVQSVSSRALTAVVGASGSGKSSAVRAGLLPHLEKDARDQWLFVVTRPGRDPFHALAANLDGLLEPATSETDRMLRARQLADALLAGSLTVSGVIEAAVARLPASPRVLLFVDQWEELYTQCADAALRNRFIEAILEASAGGAIVTVFTVRGDFFDDVLDHRPLADRLRDAVVSIGPMNRDELRQCIEEPAHRVGIRFQRGLVHRILQDVEGGAGSLPLLEFVLTELWQQRRGDELVHDAYEAMGGLSGAIAKRAEAEFAKLPADQQERLHGVMLQLVRPGATDTRRTASRAEIGEAAWPVVMTMADARLLVTARAEATGEETVEVAHEALIRHWDRLRGWLDQDREFLLWRQRLDAALEQYDAGSHDSAALLRGSLLEEARRWLGLRAARLSERERAFIATSHRNERARRWRRVANAAVLATVAVLLVLTTGRWLRNRRELAQQRAAEILRAASEEPDPAIAALLIAELDDRGAPPGGEIVARATASRPIPLAVLERAESRLTSAALSPDGTQVLTGHADGVVLLWNADGTGTPVARPAVQGSIRQVAFGADGRFALAASSEGRLRAWHVAGGGDAAPAVADLRNVADAAFAAGGASLIVASTDGTIRVAPLAGGDDGRVVHTLGGRPDRVFVDAAGLGFAVTIGSVVEVWPARGAAAPIVLRGHEDAVNHVAFDSTGSVIATASHDGTARVWTTGDGGGRIVHRSANGGAVWTAELDAGARRLLTADDNGDVVIRALDQPAVPLGSRRHTGRAWAARPAPDGRWIASAGADAALLWSATSAGETLVLAGHAADVVAVAFSARGSRLITVSRDNSVRVWPATGRGDPLVLHAASAVHAVAVAPDALTIAVATEDGSAWIWRPDDDRVLRLSGHERGVASVALDASAARLVTGSWDRTARVWDTADGRTIATLAGHAGGVTARFNATGSAIVTVSDDRTARVWSGPAFDQMVGLVGHTDIVKDAAFSADGSLVATASFDGTARVWSSPDGSPRATFRHRGPVSTVAFHRDGSRLLTASSDSTAALWTLGTDSVRYLRGHEGAVTSAVFDPAGRRVLTASKDQTARVWHADGGADPVILRGHGGQVLGARFSRDGTQVVTAATDGAARVFFSLEERSEPILLEPGAVVRDAFFTADATRIVTVSEDQAVRVWRIGWSELHAYLSSATSACLPPRYRSEHLRETATTAMSQYRDCERRHGRSTRDNDEASG